MTKELMLKITSLLWQGTEEGSKHDDCVMPVKPEQFKSLYIRKEYLQVRYAKKYQVWYTKKY